MSVINGGNPVTDPTLFVKILTHTLGWAAHLCDDNNYAVLGNVTGNNLNLSLWGPGYVWVWRNTQGPSGRMTYDQVLAIINGF